MKRVVVLSAVLAAFVTFGYGTAEARDQFPPKAGSVCDAGIAKYKAAMGAEQAGVVRISSTIDRDEATSADIATLSFGLYDEWKKKIKDVIPAALPPITETKRVVNSVYDWSKKYGLWLVVTPGADDTMRNTQVFVEARNGKKKACIPLFGKAESVDSADMPADIFS